MVTIKITHQPPGKGKRKTDRTLSLNKPEMAMVQSAIHQHIGSDKLTANIAFLLDALAEASS
jgi:hypothetical protein